MTDYLSEEVVIEINSRMDGYPLDRNGIAAAIERPAGIYFGVEVFPDLWTKAGVYVHSFSSTQYFSDGNKRTAWLAAVTFLDLNGYQVRESIADVEAEAFVLAVSRQLFNVEEDPGRTLRRAGEWFQVNTTRAPEMELGFSTEA
ncbi:type II toxin-antitoxin system death-on-curing family toxin [Mycolicibacterium smegmatis]|uniref:Death-on-curing protein n=1 Tax=Mycolicibacterium smegmatis (strain MKD8) TaxID=1214915 RepID=A0A2U9PLF8_MYCSE|nr:Fic family protein [Mycolicibacterium smegmatis]AWT52580.1 death-on-curing protein [Mycolicibacterium smegmatis MKD8]